MLEYVYVCRHGFRSNWVDPSIKTGPTGMNRDPPLAAYGTEQAARLATFLSDPSAVAPHPVPQRVFSSPFYRCIETALPTYQALSQSGAEAGEGVMLEHGAQEWYSPVRPDTGLHPRPSSPAHLAPLFPPSTVDTAYSSTFYPSREGETLKQLHDRADAFIEAWTARVEEMGVKSVVLFGHAASVIAIGRALTGDKDLEVVAGCASHSLYRRKRSTSTQSNGTAPATSSSSSILGGAVQAVREKIGVASLPQQTTPCGVGQWEPVYLGRADYLEKGVERDWSFRDAVYIDGEVIMDNGDRIPHPAADAEPVGLAHGMDKYLRRGVPEKNLHIKELKTAGSGAGVGAEKGEIQAGKNAEGREDTHAP